MVVKCGLVVSVLVFDSKGYSSNHAEVYSFSVKMFEKRKKVTKEAVAVVYCSANIHTYYEFFLKSRPLKYESPPITAIPVPFNKPKKDQIEWRMTLVNSLRIHIDQTLEFMGAVVVPQLAELLTLEF